MAKVGYETVYALRDPRDGIVKYIGRTGQRYLSVRLAQHMLDKSECPRTEWLRILRADGLRPTIEAVVKSVAPSEGVRVEQECINDYRAMGHPLLNVYKADLTAPRPAESRLKISAYRQRHKGWSHSEETKAKIGRRGVQNSAAKLTESDITKIRSLVGTGLSYKAIGAQFGVSAQTVCDIVAGKKWRHVA